MKNTRISKEFLLKKLCPLWYQNSLTISFQFLYVQILCRREVYWMIHGLRSYVRQALMSPICQLNFIQANDEHIIRDNWNLLGIFHSWMRSTNYDRCVQSCTHVGSRFNRSNKEDYYLSNFAIVHFPSPFLIQLIWKKMTLILKAKIET